MWPFKDKPLPFKEGHHYNAMFGIFINDRAHECGYCEHAFEKNEVTCCKSNANLPVRKFANADCKFKEKE